MLNQCWSTVFDAGPTLNQQIESTFCDCLKEFIYSDIIVLRRSEKNNKGYVHVEVIDYENGYAQSHKKNEMNRALGHFCAHIG